MQKTRLSYRKRIIRIPALGLVILGILCISWALTNIFQQSNLINHAKQSVFFDELANLDTLFPLLNKNIHSALKEIQLVKTTTNNNPKPVDLSQGDVIGSLLIPTLDLTLPIVEGTDENTLRKGVGHFSQSVMPGTADNCVLSGHRDTVFSKLGKVVIGDLLIIESSTGTYTYKVSHTRIVENDDRTVITPTDHGVLTLTTCYPFLFIGNTTQRYIVSADLIVEE